MVRPDDNHDNFGVTGYSESKSESTKKGNMRMTECVRGGCYHEDGLFGETTFRTAYIVRIRVFYGLVLVLSLISLYLNYISIRRTYKILY